MSDNEYCAALSAPHLRDKLQQVPSSFSTTDGFYIQINLQLCYQQTLECVDDEDKEIEDFVVVDCYKSEKVIKTGYLRAICDRLERDNLPWNIVSTKLSEMGVPLQKQPFMLHQITKCADDIIKEERNKNEKILPMVVSASAMVDKPYDVSCLGESEAIPASKEAIEGLKKGKVDNGWVHAYECEICIHDFVEGSNVIEMPCNHVFHGDCIVKWIGVCNFCPVCLYQLPV